MIRSILKITGKLLVSLLLLSYLTLYVEWPEILQALHKTDIKLYLISTFLLLLQVLFNSGKFYIFLRNSKIQRTFNFIVKINFISRFYAIFLPANVGRMAVRWYKITENRHERVFFLAVTIFERMLHVSILVFFGLMPLVFYTGNSKISALRDAVLPAALILLIISTIGLLYFLFPSIHKYSKGLVARISAGTHRWQNRATVFFEKFSMDLLTMPAFSMVFVLNFLWLIFFTCRVFVLSKALGLPLYYLDMVWISCLVLLLQVLPVSLAGIGIREGAYAYLFSLFGLAPEKGVLLGILLLSQMILVALIGGVLELIKKESE